MGILYLRIMCMIESKNEKVYDAIEALRKTVKRLSINSDALAASLVFVFIPRAKVTVAVGIAFRGNSVVT